MSDTVTADETIVELRETLQAAKEARPSDRDGHLKAALGEAVDLRARDLPNSADLKEAIENAIVAPEEEKPFFLNRALTELERVEERAGEWGLFDDPDARPPADVLTDTADAVDVDEPAPEGVRWTDADHGVVELELSRPIIEWIELEAAEHDISVVGWIHLQIWGRLRDDLETHHGPTADVEVDLPDDFAHRVSLWLADYRLRGEREPADLSAFLSNHTRIRETWLLDGEPWALAEEAGLHDHRGDEVADE